MYGLYKAVQLERNRIRQAVGNCGGVGIGSQWDIMTNERVAVHRPEVYPVGVNLNPPRKSIMMSPWSVDLGLRWVMKNCVFFLHTVDIGHHCDGQFMRTYTEQIIFSFCVHLAQVIQLVRTEGHSKSTPVSHNGNIILSQFTKILNVGFLPTELTKPINSNDKKRLRVRINARRWVASFLLSSYLTVEWIGRRPPRWLRGCALMHSPRRVKKAANRTRVAAQNMSWTIGGLRVNISTISAELPRRIEMPFGSSPSR